MTNEQQQVKDMMQAFLLECPEKPTIPDLETRKLRAKLILEEALETIKGLGVDIKLYHPSLPTVHWICSGDTSSQIEFCRGCEPNLKEILDGCQDLKVVTEGTLLACGLVSKPQYETKCFGHGEYEKVLVSEDPHFNEVMRSNMSKMWTLPELIANNRMLDYIVINTSSMNEDELSNTDRVFIVKNKDGKFIKPPSYSPPNFNLG